MFLIPPQSDRDRMAAWLRPEELSVTPWPRYGGWLMSKWDSGLGPGWPGGIAPTFAAIPRRGSQQLQGNHGRSFSPTRIMERTTHPWPSQGRQGNATRVEAVPLMGQEAASAVVVTAPSCLAEGSLPRLPPTTATVCGGESETPVPH